MLFILIAIIFIVTLTHLYKTGRNKWNTMCADDVYYVEFEHAVKTLAQSKREL